MNKQNIFINKPTKNNWFSSLLKKNKNVKNDANYTFEFYYDIDLQKPKLAKIPKHMSIVNPNLKNNLNYKNIQYFDIDLKKERIAFIPKYMNILPYEIKETYKSQNTQTSSTPSFFTVFDNEESSIFSIDNDEINFFEYKNLNYSDSILTDNDIEIEDENDIINNIIDTYIYDEYYQNNSEFLE